VPARREHSRHVAAKHSSARASGAAASTRKRSLLWQIDNVRDGVHIRIICARARRARLPIRHTGGLHRQPTLPPYYAHVCTYYHHCTRTHAHVYKSIYLRHNYFSPAGNTHRGSRRGKMRLFCAKVQCFAILSNSRQWQKARADSPSSWRLFCERRVHEPGYLLGSPSLTLYSHSCMYVCMYSCIYVCIVCSVCVYVCIYVHIKACKAFR
jgi:hypothetical protein